MKQKVLTSQSRFKIIYIIIAILVLLAILYPKRSGWMFAPDNALEGTYESASGNICPCYGYTITKSEDVDYLGSKAFRSENFCIGIVGTNCDAYF